MECRHPTRTSNSNALIRPQAGALAAPAIPLPHLSFGDYGGNLFRLVFPAIEQLPRADEDARAARGLAIPVNKELGDIAIARFRWGQDAEDSEVFGERHTHASRMSAKEIGRASCRERV